MGLIGMWTYNFNKQQRRNKMILHGHVLDKLQEVESDSVQCVVTSPPYWGLRDYGTATWEGGDENCEHIQRTNKQGGEADRPHRELETFQYKDICKKCGAKRTDDQIGLEKTPELYVAKMVKVFREIKRVLRDDGTVWLNLGDSYNTTQAGNKTWGDGVGANKHYKDGSIPKKRNTNIGLKTKDLCGIPWRVAFALQADGWYLRSDIIWHKPNPMPESVTDRPTKSHEYIFLLSKSQKYFYDAEAVKEPVSEFSTFTKASNITPYGKESGKAKGLGCGSRGNSSGRNKRTVWTINTQPYKEAHFAVFPPRIPELCIRAGTKEGDTVLDPFFGSGTTGWVAQRLGRKWIGIELNAEYIKIAEKRFIQHELF